MKNILKSVLATLALVSTSCFAFNDVKKDLQAMYPKTLSADAIDQLNETFQGFNAFFYKEGYKYPGYINYNRGPGALIISFMCGTNQDGRVFLAKDPEHLANLVPVRILIHEPQPNMKVDLKLEGYSETALGRAAYKLASATFFKKKEYKGTIIVDEYNAEHPKPFYFALGSLQDFRGLKTYLAKNLTPRDVKPLLFLKIDKQGADELSDDDKAFLTTYFTLLDPNNSTVKSFFIDADKNLFDAQKIFKDARPCGEKFGDLAMNSIEKVFGEFKYEKIAMIAATLVIGGWGLKKMWETAKDKYTGKKSNPAYIDPFTYENKDNKKSLSSFMNGVKYATIGGISIATIALLATWIKEAQDTVTLKRTPKAPKAPEVSEVSEVSVTA